MTKGGLCGTLPAGYAEVSLDVDDAGEPPWRQCYTQRFVWLFFGANTNIDWRLVKMGVWESKSGELATAYSHDFERLVLPLLRPFWPDLIRPMSLRELDNAGIDLVVWSEDGVFPCVVQCKGFYANEQLGEPQYEQIVASIDSFDRSGFRCKEYLLVHNRERKAAEIHQRIEKRLAGLRDSGKAEVTKLLDRQSLIKAVRLKLSEVIAQHFAEDSRWQLEQQTKLFTFGDLFVSRVPATIENWRVRRGKTADGPTKPSPAGLHDVADLIASPEQTRWVLVTGHFGVGKTTAVLHAAASSQNRLIYIRAQDLPNEFGSVGTNYLMQNIVRGRDLFSDFDDATRAELDRLAGPLLAGMLRKSESDFVLVVDGIDENYTYSSLRGMVQLTNELAELTCPIVLTTRKEHFESTFSNFEFMADELSTTRASRPAKIIDLQIWTDAEVCNFLSQAESRATPQQRARLKGILELARTGEIYKVFRGLPRHPLFLQMLLDRAVDGRTDFTNRVQLIEEWVEAKIRRDLTVNRETPTEIVDRDTFVAGMMTLMGEVANRMTAMEGNAYYLLEVLDSASVCTIAKEVLDEREIDISTIVTTSVLQPAARRKKSMPVKFFHRILHEFFLARYLHSHSRPHDGFPPEVSQLYRESEAGGML